MNWSSCSVELRLAHLEVVLRANELHDVDCPVLGVRKAQRLTGAYVIPQPCTCWLADEIDGEDI